jgi:hypothetical protein
MTSKNTKRGLITISNIRANDAGEVTYTVNVQDYSKTRHPHMAVWGGVCYEISNVEDIATACAKAARWYFGTGGKLRAEKGADRPTYHVI